MKSASSRRPKVSPQAALDLQRQLFAELAKDPEDIDTNRALGLISSGARLAGKSVVGYTLLTLSIAQGHDVVSCALVDAGANVNSVDRYKSSPLESAIFYGREDVALHLMANGAQGSNWLLRRAAYFARNKVFHALVDAGYNIFHRDEDGATLLMLASGTHRYHDVGLSLCSFLVKSGLSVHDKDNDGKIALHYGVSSRGLETVGLLIAHGTDVNARSATGRTPLMEAAATGDIAMANLLISSGAKTLIANEIGLTARMIADMYEKPDMSAFLAQAEKDDIQNLATTCKVARLPRMKIKTSRPV